MLRLAPLPIPSKSRPRPSSGWARLGPVERPVVTIWLRQPAGGQASQRCPDLANPVGCRPRERLPRGSSEGAAVADPARWCHPGSRAKGFRTRRSASRTPPGPGAADPRRLHAAGPGGSGRRSRPTRRKKPARLPRRRTRLTPTSEPACCWTASLSRAGIAPGGRGGRGSPSGTRRSLRPLWYASRQTLLCRTARSCRTRATRSQHGFTAARDESALSSE